MHVDDFIDDYGTDSNANWFLMLRRLPAVLMVKFDKQIERYKLRCTFESERWFIIGASRLGDVWLSKDGDFPYEKRVDIKYCSKFTLITEE
jgi:hypothetical protein